MRMVDFVLIPIKLTIIIDRLRANNNNFSLVDKVSPSGYYLNKFKIDIANNSGSSNDITSVAITSLAMFG